ncbi:sodium/solute symporter [Melioribacteraceae bacterium 4301-Me]|uniref:sodium:solute symporter family transporter n=1 Tax=Pyranulibacter aquaticus TaxID=3163344 RepID=UPI003595B68B
MSENFNLLDGIIVIAYLLAVIVIGLYNSKNRDKNVNEYFLAGRNLSWFAVGISLFATNISSEHFIGLAGSGSMRGLAVGQFELIAIFLLILLGWVIAPIYKKSGILTTPEFLEKRFGSSSRKFFSGLSIFTYIITKILVTLFAGGILFNKMFGWSIFSSAIVVVLLTGFYTLVGGFYSVVKTQVFQGIILFSAALVLTILGLNEIGGFSTLKDKLPSEYFQMFKPVDDPDFPWTGIVFGAPIIAFWYWCADHYMVQRVLGAKSINDARNGTILTAFLKIFPIFILVLPGLIAATLFPGLKGDDAYPVLLSSEIVPSGIKGFVIAGLLAAIMSSLAASFNSIAALYTIDFYKPTHPNASERTLVFVGRMVTIAVVVGVILIAPFVKIVNSQIYIFLQSTQAYISAPISAVFLFGFTMKKTNARAAFTALIIGEFIGISRFIVEILIKSNLISNLFLVSFVQINYLHFTIFLFLTSALIILLLSYLPSTASEKVDEGYNWMVSLKSSELSYNKNIVESGGLKFNVLISGLILILTLSLWTIFI